MAFFSVWIKKNNHISLFIVLKIQSFFLNYSPTLIPCNWNMKNKESFPIKKNSEEEINLPPGFRFHPTDEELITYYLSNKALNSKFNAIAIDEVELNRCEPWELAKKSKLGEKEWYFFSARGRKYPTGLRTNRATGAGYWKATGRDKEILSGKMLVGMKKTLVFYKGRPPKGEKTDWVMHEYRLEGNHYAQSNWVVCRVFKKSSLKRSPLMDSHVTCFSNSFLQDAAFNSSFSSFKEIGGPSTAMNNTEICFDNEDGRNSFDECL